MRSILILVLSSSFGCGQLQGADTKQSSDQQTFSEPTAESEDASGTKPKKTNKRRTSETPETNHTENKIPDEKNQANASDLPLATLPWDGVTEIGSSTLRLVPIE